jgi:acetylornithine deacetylase/succinyl-diaminopimelate desuccinylase-like protein
VLKEASLTTRELDELFEFLRIPSISADPSRAGDVRAAADWLVALIRAGGGEAAIVERDGRPLIDALVPASRPASGPPLLCYGHFDVQPPGPAELWGSDPFSPEVRGGWLYARGVADDKGQLWALLRAALDLSRAGALPIGIRFCLDSEEEVGGTAIVDYLAETAGDARACVIFDTAMLDADTPVLTVGTRGTLYLHLEVRAGDRDLHSGVYGGAALNAVHVLVAALGRLIQQEGRLPEPLLTDVVEPDEQELRDWQVLPPGERLLAAQGALPADEDAGREFYLRTWALPSIDVNGIEAGSPVQQKTIVVSSARANLSMRLASGQRVEVIAPIVEELLRRELPAGVRLDVQRVASCDPALTATDSRAVQLATKAIENATGKRPLLLRSGGSLPLMPLLERLEIPAVVSGFDVPDGNIHAPNERMLVTHLGLALAAARELYLAFADL